MFFILSHVIKLIRSFIHSFFLIFSQSCFKIIISKFVIFARKPCQEYVLTRRINFGSLIGSFPSKIGDAIFFSILSMEIQRKVIPNENTKSNSRKILPKSSGHSDFSNWSILKWHPRKDNYTFFRCFVPVALFCRFLRLMFIYFVLFRDGFYQIFHIMGFFIKRWNILFYSVF